MQAGEIGFTHLTVMARTPSARPSTRRSCSSWLGKTHPASSTTSACTTATPPNQRTPPPNRPSSPRAGSCTSTRRKTAAYPSSVSSTRLAGRWCATRSSRWPASRAITTIATRPSAGPTPWSSWLPPKRKSRCRSPARSRPHLWGPRDEVAGGCPGAETEFSLPVSSKTVGRWACDCSVTRILMQDSVVIDVGRAERTIKGPRRRALIARDRHCQWTGCERPASQCDGHHLLHWARNGGGEIANQVLLCHRHHWLVHEGGWQLVKTHDGEIITVAPAVGFGLPKGPD
jgi:hypothetical protein